MSNIAPFRQTDSRPHRPHMATSDDQYKLGLSPPSFHPPPNGVQRIPLFLENHILTAKQEQRDEIALIPASKLHSTQIGSFLPLVIMGWVL